MKFNTHLDDKKVSVLERVHNARHKNVTSTQQVDYIFFLFMDT